jgi:hypothetical protein
VGFYWMVRVGVGVGEEILLEDWIGGVGVSMDRGQREA